jgi:hypothetical protein
MFQKRRIVYYNGSRIIQEIEVDNRLSQTNEYIYIMINDKKLEKE